MPQDDIPTSIVDKSARHTPEWKLHWLFRLALIGEFVGLVTSWCAVIIAVPRFTWKHATEFLYVPAQVYSAWWEVKERDSGYAAPLLWIGFQRALSAHGVAAPGVIRRPWLRWLGEVWRRVHARLLP